MLEPVAAWLVALEWGLIILVAWLATQSLHDFSRHVQISGVDLVPLTRAADFAGQFLRSSGKIPVWDPFIGNGEPMLEAVQSFILNPLMSVPILLLGAKPGVLIVVILHAMLLGLGGWAWGRVMGFGTFGRLLVGTLLVSSGSLTGALSHGVFELAMSQAYVPFVYAGLIALLYVPGQRWGLLLFVTATAMLVFSGTFWYVLPTAFGCGIIAALALVDFKGRQVRLDEARFGLLLAAGLMVVGVAAVRVLTINRDLLQHPDMSYDIQISYPQVYINYFDPTFNADKSQWFAIYHYVVPMPLMLGIAGLALLTWRWVKHDLVGGWRIVVAGIVIILVMSFFGTGPTPVVNAIYNALAFLKDWRNPGRMAAAASPWVVLAAGWFFDRLARVAWSLYPSRLVRAAALTGLLLAGGMAAILVADNWPQSVVLIPTANLFLNQADAARLLRQLYPSSFLAIHTSWIEHYALNETLIRHTYGDDEVFTIGMPPTIGSEGPQYLEEFAFGDSPDSGNGKWLHDQGYVAVSNVPILPELGPSLDYNPSAPPYAFVVPEQTILDTGSKRLLR
ncbi:MAG TPA: hypothetical protein VMT24_04455, partial [Aggregatilineaceae bacterium]|nr:hypothetical protein [Aggregatilineaceae bacterium]